jgi:hypothetical protein
LAGQRADFDLIAIRAPAICFGVIFELPGYFPGREVTL